MMIREKGTRSQFKRCLYASVIRLQCRACGRVYVMSLDQVQEIAVHLVTLFNCEACVNEAQTELKARMDKLWAMPPPTLGEARAQFEACANQAAMGYDPGDSYR